MSLGGVTLGFLKIIFMKSPFTQPVKSHLSVFSSVVVLCKRGRGQVGISLCHSPFEMSFSHIAAWCQGGRRGKGERRQFTTFLASKEKERLCERWIRVASPLSRDTLKTVIFLFFPTPPDSMKKYRDGISQLETRNGGCVKGKR